MVWFPFPRVVPDPPEKRLVAASGTGRKGCIWGMWDLHPLAPEQPPPPSSSTPVLKVGVKVSDATPFRT